MIRNLSSQTLPLLDNILLKVAGQSILLGSRIQRSNSLITFDFYGSCFFNALDPIIRICVYYVQNAQSVRKRTLKTKIEKYIFYATIAQRPSINQIQEFRNVCASSAKKNGEKSFSLSNFFPSLVERIIYCSLNNTLTSSTGQAKAQVVLTGGEMILIFWNNSRKRTDFFFFFLFLAPPLLLLFLIFL